jgi:hypothetical protein
LQYRPSFQARPFFLCRQRWSHRTRGLVFFQVVLKEAHLSRHDCCSFSAPLQLLCSLLMDWEETRVCKWYRYQRRCVRSHHHPQQMADSNKYTSSLSLCLHENRLATG